MSLAATLRPNSLPFSSTLAGVYGQATDKTSYSNTLFNHDSNYLSLNRMLIRFQTLILLTPAPTPSISLETSPTTSILDELTPLQRQIQAELYSPLPYHRTKWLHNIQGARNLLLQLERQAQGLKVQRTKRDALKDLSEKRAIIKRLRNRVEEIAREVEGSQNNSYGRNHSDTKSAYRHADDELLGDRVEDILGDRLRVKPPKKPNRDDDDLQEGRPIANITEDTDTNRNKLFNSNDESAFRHRRNQNSTSNNDKHEPNSKTSGFSSLPTTEKQLDMHSKTQENLTSSLVSMAAQLKQQARAFEFTLDQDKTLLDRALEGLDRNVSAMDLAGRNMATLRRMSEGEGWWGRMKLYGIIFGGWIIAVLLVFVMPKLRF